MSAAYAAPPPAPRRRRPSRRLLTLLALVAVGAAAVGYVAAGALAYDQLSRVDADCGGWWPGQSPATLAARQTAPEHDAAFAGQPYRIHAFGEVAFPSRDARWTIRAWWAPAGGEPGAAPVVILVHGRGKCRRDPEVLVPAGMLHRAGFGVLLMDLRDHGSSDVEDGRFSGMEEHLDVLGAWDWVRALPTPPERIGLYAVSLGGGVGAIAMGQEPRLAAAFLDSAWADPMQAAGEYAESLGRPSWLAAAAFAAAPLIGGDDLRAFSPVQELERHLAGRPLALVHGTADTTVPAHHARDLAAAAGRGGTEVVPWLVDGAGHVDAIFLAAEEYERRLVGFFERALTDG